MEVRLSEKPRFPVSPQGHRIWAAYEIEDIMRRAKLKESYSQIALVYHTSRSGIAGLIKRQRDKAGVKVVKAEPKAKKQARPSPAPFKPKGNFTFNPGFALRPREIPVKRVRLKLVENPNYVTFQELQPNHCKFPFGDPRQSDFRFCGCERVPGKPYCAGHNVIAGKMYEKGKE